MSEPIHPNKLAAMRAQAYPDIIDDNGVHWYMSELTRLRAECEGKDARLQRAEKILYDIADQYGGKAARRF